MLIVNLTTQSYFRSSKNKYYNILLELLTPQEYESISHWSKKDKIVICPKHIENYVEKKYAEVFIN